MNPRIKAVALASLLLPCLAACSSVTHQRDPAAHLQQMNHIFVEHRLEDGKNIDQLIARELRSLGYDASSGPMTMMPDGTEAILAYQETWTFDFSTYLIELDVAVRDAKTGKEIAVGRYFHPAVFAKDPSTIIAEVVDPIFKR